MTNQLRPSDLKLKHNCQKCGQPMTAHAVPWGSPLAFLVTGYCGKCGGTYLSLREGSEEGITGAAQQLIEHFHQVVLRKGQPDLNIVKN